MSTFAEYTQYDATGLAELLKAKEVTPTEVLESAISQIERHNPSLNAVVHKQFDRARSQIQSCDPNSAPLAGVPFLLKDLLGEDKGEPSTSSCPPMKDWLAPEDSELVRRFKQSGLQILGRTNTPQLGIYGVTESDFRGPCRNPWNVDHTPGGSSGGSAAAVAASFPPDLHDPSTSPARPPFAPSGRWAAMRVWSSRLKAWALATRRLALASSSTPR